MSTGSFQFVDFDSFSPLSKVGPYSLADFMELDEDQRIELIRGRFVVSPCPWPLHQIVVLELSLVLSQAQDKGGGLLLLAPMDVILDDRNALQPDLLYLAKDRLAQVGKNVQGPPSLVIEILSPSTANRDRQEKLDLYAKFGVPEYWLVDPEPRSIDFLVNDHGRYVVTTPVDDVYRSAVTPEIEIRLVDFWREVARRTPGNLK